MKLLLLITVLLLLAAAWLWDERRIQLGPHLVQDKIGVRVMNEYWTTNPAYVTWTCEMYVGTNGVQYRQTPHTNQLWTVWRIFR
jgi:hypothetical protein